MKSEMVETNIEVKPKKNFSKIIIFCVVILLIAGGAFYFLNKKSSNVSISLTERTATVDTEDLSTTITGSGSMLSSNIMNVSAKTNGTIQKLYYKQGDKVKAGAVICQLDPSDALSSVQNAQNNLDQAELTQQQSVADAKKLTVTAPIDGQITNITVNQGDIVSPNGILYTITDNRNINLTVPFNGNDIKKIKIGESANINLQNIMQTVKGRVIDIGNAPYSTAQGGDLYNVEFAITNPGSLTEGIKASADIILKKETISSADVGSLAFTNKIVVRSDTGGTVEKVNAKLYQEVRRGELLMKLTNQDVTNQIQGNTVKISGLKQQLDLSKKQLAYCTLTAPISGEITAISNKEGETLKIGDVLTSITDVSHMQFTIPVDELDIAKIKIGQKVNVNVDALTETATLPLIGKVSDIAVEGAASNGVTTYDVTIAITGVTDPRTLFSRFRAGNSGGSGNTQNANGNRRSGYGGGNGNSGYGNRSGYGQGSGGSGYGNRASGSAGGQGNFGFARGNGTGGSNRFASMFNTSDLLSSLKDGMNADAEIVIADYKNSVAVPLEAITRYKGQSYVMVKSDAATVAALKKSGKYVDIFADTTATTGSSNSQASSNGGNGYQRSGNSGSGYQRSGNSGYGNSGYGNGGSQTSNSNSMSSIRNALEQYKTYYKDAIPTAVQVGVNTSSSIQIVSGVKVGDIVLLPPIVTSSKSASSNSSGGSGFGMFGGMGGGFGGGGGGQYRNSGNGGNNRGSGSSSNRSGGGN